VAEDRLSGRHGGRVATRFPPEPNGYLHIGHAKSICLNFGIADEFAGTCNLRFDDTNPAKEDVEYVDAIKEDVEWLGFEWNALFFASDYFERFYDCAVQLITRGRAYVDSLTAKEIREYRGTLTEPGRNSPYRDRPVAENLDLFARMRAGEFEDGMHVLRAKIDMASPNFNMRDPTLYRIRHATHHRTGDAWCIYPMYDFAHPLSDAIERITHSLCTLEFEDHRPLYDWLVHELGDALEGARPQQIEFARLNLNYTVMSKRKLLQLVQLGHVSGWDDPRLPTISGLRRRGYTPESIRDFCQRIGVAKKENVIDVAQLEFCIREDLNRHAPRVMAVLRHHQLPGRPGRRGRRHQQPRGRLRRHPEGALFAGPVHRTGRFPGGAAEEVLPALSWKRSAPALRVLHHVHRRRERCRRGHRRAAVHVRPGDARRRLARWPQGESHHALGVRAPRRNRGGAPVRSPVLNRGS
jgi:glutaminyl-tRNA synthetase